jgi:type VI protein secretion system component VasF
VTGTTDAGTGPPVPASSSRDVVPHDARTELDRIRRRWAELPLGRAEEAAPAVRAVLGDLADRTARGARVPDLGVAALADQLAVLVWDACAADRAEGIPDVLTELRRSLP